MPQRRRLGVIATLLVLLCASCTNSEEPPAGSPTATTSSTPATSPTLTASPTAPTASPSSTTHSVPAYLTKYTADERQAYSDALGDYRSYRAQEARFARRATSPVAARRFYREYTADWVSYWALRHQMADAAIRVVGVPKVKWSRPALIRLTGDGGGTVHLRLSLDARDVKVTKRGEPVPQNTTPTISRISMSRLPEDVRWKFLMAEAGAPC